jgi:hypothetical protein
MVGGWVPGTAVVQYPEGTGVPLQAGKVLVMQVHYNTQNGPLTADHTQVKLQYSKAPVAKPATITALANFLFSIPAKAKGYRSWVTVNAPSGLNTLWGVLPHMHTKGTRIQVDMNGQCLMDIPKWDFHWQQLYLYSNPIPVQVGKPVTLTCTWDNPTDHAVGWGEGTDDEMCLNYFYLTQ